ncbi:MAG: MBL fold metallo-hydrolase [Gammaproteobacteria bacterium]|nr:MBL fold metallo-hydrolase [Gammaproteobacteria bacterium]GIS70316.1 MAG: MBL fold metallo-hydrolase [Gammaproteobacteria bacterium]|tara:strand:+ start:167 stop:1072 length:906 start_codon:yes stop_codon:yes gene_type:complete
MSVTIPYVRDLDFEYGRTDQISKDVRRVIANNPSAFTLYGTGTYILGHGDVAVVDPGPADPGHIDAILRATEGETITHMLVTHTHMDHSPGCALLADHCDAETYAYGPHGSGKQEQGIVVEEGGDTDFRPDNKIGHGDIIDAPSWSVECVYTPGHTSNHVCYALASEGALFSGDHVMGWSTSVISPPDGDMEAYMASLRLLRARDDAIYWPTHGPAITQTHGHVDAFIAHRNEREEQIMEALRGGITTIAEMVPGMYRGVPEYLHGAAARSVFAAMEYLVKRGDVVCEDGDPSIGAHYRSA